MKPNESIPQTLNRAADFSVIKMKNKKKSKFTQLGMANITTSFFVWTGSFDCKQFA